jgi:hypothetical protein
VAFDFNKDDQQIPNDQTGKPPINPAYQPRAISEDANPPEREGQDFRGGHAEDRRTDVHELCDEGTRLGSSGAKARKGCNEIEELQAGKDLNREHSSLIDTNQSPAKADFRPRCGCCIFHICISQAKDSRERADLGRAFVLVLYGDGSSKTG